MLGAKEKCCILISISNSRLCIIDNPLCAKNLSSFFYKKIDVSNKRLKYFQNVKGAFSSLFYYETADQTVQSGYFANLHLSFEIK